MARRRGLTDSQILELLFDDLPSDYNEDTDEESEERAPEIIVDPLDAPQLNLDNDATVVIIGDVVDEPEPETPREDASKRRWKKKPEPAMNTEFSPLPTVTIAASTPLDTFLEFFDEEILDKIHFETNLKSVQKGKPAAISKDEIKVFLGINMIMGYHSLPSIANYWSTQKDLEVLPIKNAMSRERFQTILSNLHVNDNTKMDPGKKDKLFKIRPLLEHLNDKFKQKRSLSEHLCIDESMILFKGRSSLKQYNPMKPIKRGYKLWCLADDAGYIYMVIVYTGKAESQRNCEQRKLLGLGGDVVMSLLQNVKEKNHKLFFDNFFSSIPLLEMLRSRDVLACGTIRSSRKDFPQLIDDKALKRGDFDYRSTPLGITVFKWMDSKPVHLISNYHGTSMDSVQRKQKDGTKVTVTCPNVVSDYNKHMGGVDKHDMLRQLYGADRKSKKWWHRLFFGLLDMAMINSYILHSECNEENQITQFDYYREVALGLLTYAQRTQPGPAKRRKSNYSTPDSVRLGNAGIHWPEFTTNKNRCEVCSKNGIQARPLSKCSHCGVHLCCTTVKNCFRIYHSE